MLSASAKSISPPGGPNAKHLVCGYLSFRSRARSEATPAPRECPARTKEYPSHSPPAARSPSKQSSSSMHLAMWTATRSMPPWALPEVEVGMLKLSSLATADTTSGSAVASVRRSSVLRLPRHAMTTAFFVLSLHMMKGTVKFSIFTNEAYTMSSAFLFVARRKLSKLLPHRLSPGDLLPFRRVRQQLPVNTQGSKSVSEHPPQQR
mmetsp:Transcript_6758/g.26131  ORF Transcript_6758/g.26131 Transcript_6758/m.26131 type:complete len:206 (+) Transcript_6758:1682-2299(+)